MLEQDDIQSWLDGVSGGRSDEDMLLLREVCDFVLNTQEASGWGENASTLHYAIAVGDILNGMALDVDTIAAAILHYTLSGIMI